MFRESVILVVDDDPIMLQYLSYLLKKESKKLYFATNGEQGLEYYKKYSPDIVITDLNMPIMNGIVMSKHIKDIRLLQPIILLTAYGDIKDLQDAINIGLNAFLSKPIKSKELLYSTLEKLLFTAENNLTEDDKKVSYVVKNLLHDNQEYINYEELYNQDDKNI